MPMLVYLNYLLTYRNASRVARSHTLNNNLQCYIYIYNKCSTGPKQGYTVWSPWISIVRLSSRKHWSRAMMTGERMSARPLKSHRSNCVLSGASPAVCWAGSVELRFEWGQITVANHQSRRFPTREPSWQSIKNYNDVRRQESTQMTTVSATSSY